MVPYRLGFRESTGNFIAISRSLLRAQGRTGESTAFCRPRPDVVREDGAIGEAQDEGGMLLPHRVVETMGVIMYMATLTTNENTPMG